MTSNVNSVGTCTEPSIGAGTHFEKIFQTGLQPAMVENCWLAVFIVTCTLGLAAGLLRITHA